MPSHQSQEPEPEFDTETRHYSPASSRGETARYDEAVQQQIIALAGQLQDRERATVSLEQLESIAEEAGLEPRFVREAARRIALRPAPVPSSPKPLAARAAPRNNTRSTVTASVIAVIAGAIGGYLVLSNGLTGLGVAFSITAMVASITAALMHASNF